MKRLPRMKPGVLEVVWGKTKDMGEDIYYVHGPGTSKADSHLAHIALGCERYSTASRTYMPSFLDELKARGYDITTFRMTVKKVQEKQQ